MDLGPDHRLYISVGADCNICLPTSSLAAGIDIPDQSIVSMELGKGQAGGLRAAKRSAGVGVGASRGWGWLKVGWGGV